MLKEIHLSKISFCSFANKAEDSQQDFIVESIDDIFKKQAVVVGKDDEGNPIKKKYPVIQIAKEARATRLTKMDIPTKPEDVKINLFISIVNQGWNLLMTVRI